MIKNIKKLVPITFAIAIFTGCATTNQNQIVIKQPTPKMKSDMKKIRQFAKEPTKKDIQKQLLKKSPYYAQKHKKEAMKVNLKLKPNIPLYRQPFFAQMTVFPYVSKKGIYHSYQTVYIKIKDGEWVIANPMETRPSRTFDYNEVN